ncbi:LuxR family transcriptional regulator [Aureimonas sp. SK2]|uniref:helix-turn-helix transcriptional regulator n=1 Tax=Aureimonas sp. SK2 TaxID=3015992 RepID=UPI002444EC7E|nr:LuxR family transcriptional regulator [Aureimonas sp. SK2]
MNRPEASFVGRLERPWSEKALRDAVGEIVGSAGFDRFALMTIPSTDEAGAEMRPLLSNWEDEFRLGFERLGLHRFSPVVRALISGSLPFIWDVEFIYGFDPDDPNGSPPPGRFLAAHGCQSGVYCPVHGISGFTGVLAVAGPRPAMGEAEADGLQLLAFAAFGVLAACRYEENRRNNPLTNRERDCLKLAMLGKTSPEIGTILNLSEHTISQYLTSATRKLDASNRTHAVALAAQLGYLS